MAAPRVLLHTLVLACLAGVGLGQAQLTAEVPYRSPADVATGVAYGSGVPNLGVPDVTPSTATLAPNLDADIFAVWNEFGLGLLVVVRDEVHVDRSPGAIVGDFLWLKVLDTAGLTLLDTRVSVNASSNLVTTDGGQLRTATVERRQATNTTLYTIGVDAAVLTKGLGALGPGFTFQLGIAIADSSQLSVFFGWAPAAAVNTRGRPQAGIVTLRDCVQPPAPLVGPGISRPCQFAANNSGCNVTAACEPGLQPLNSLLCLNGVYSGQAACASVSADQQLMVVSAATFAEAETACQGLPGGGCDLAIVKKSEVHERLRLLASMYSSSAGFFLGLRDQAPTNSLGQPQDRCIVTSARPLDVLCDGGLSVVGVSTAFEDPGAGCGVARPRLAVDRRVDVFKACIAETRCASSTFFREEPLRVDYQCASGFLSDMGSRSWGWPDETAFRLSADFHKFDTDEPDNNVIVGGQRRKFMGLEPCVVLRGPVWFDEPCGNTDPVYEAPFPDLRVGGMCSCPVGASPATTTVPNTRAPAANTTTPAPNTTTTSTERATSRPTAITLTTGAASAASPSTSTPAPQSVVFFYDAGFEATIASDADRVSFAEAVRTSVDEFLMSRGLTTAGGLGGVVLVPGSIMASLTVLDPDLVGPIQSGVAEPEAVCFSLGGDRFCALSVNPNAGSNNIDSTAGDSAASGGSDVGLIVGISVAAAVLVLLVVAAVVVSRRHSAQTKPSAMRAADEKGPDFLGFAYSNPAFAGSGTADGQDPYAIPSATREPMLALAGSGEYRALNLADASGAQPAQMYEAPVLSGLPLGDPAIGGAYEAPWTDSEGLGRTPSDKAAAAARAPAGATAAATATAAAPQDGGYARLGARADGLDQPGPGEGPSFKGGYASLCDLVPGAAAEAASSTYATLGNVVGSADAVYGRMRPRRVSKRSSQVFAAETAAAEAARRGVVYAPPPEAEEEVYESVQKRSVELARSAITLGPVLGRGQFGEVHRGHVQPPGSDIQAAAIKMLKPGAEARARVEFLREAHIVGQFDHPNIVALHGVVTAGEPVLIVLELLMSSLLQCLRAGLYGEDAEERLCCAVDIACGCAYLESSGFIHRDLAARNVLVAESGSCKIADFGLAKSSTYYHASGKGKIPVRWTALESLFFKRFTTKSDVWSFGIVLHEIYSDGAKPYRGMRNDEVVLHIDSGARLPPAPLCPHAVYEVMLRCWAAEPAERPTFAEARSELLEILSDRQLRATAVASRTPSTTSGGGGGAGGVGEGGSGAAGDVPQQPDFVDDAVYSSPGFLRKRSDHGLGNAPERVEASCYHGGISREVAERVLLAGRQTPGRFLLRSKGQHQLVISIVAGGGKLIHHRIATAADTGGAPWMFNGRPCAGSVASMDSLVEWLRQPRPSVGSTVPLTTAVPRFGGWYYESIEETIATSA